MGEWAQYDFARKRVDSCVRLSPHYYNTEAELSETAARVAEIAREPEVLREALRFPQGLPVATRSARVQRDVVPEE